MVGTHCHLGYIDVAISCLHQTEVFLRDSLTSCCKLCDSADRSRLRRLTTSVGVNLGVEYEDVHIFARSEHVVKTAVTDVIRCTVTTDDPLATLREEVAEFIELCATWATVFLTCLDEWEELVGCCATCCCIVLACFPFLCCCLELFRCAVASLSQEGGDASAHLLVGEQHTHTKFAEVLEE